MKRFCIFAANYFPNLGGIERYTYNLARELVRLGHALTIVTNNVYSLPEIELIQGIQVIRVPCWNVLHGRFPVLRFGGDFLRLHKKLMEESFDLVIIQARFYIHSLYGASYASKKEIPRILIEHGTNHFSVNNPLLDYTGHIYEHLITKLVKRKCSNYYGVSQESCNWLKHFGIQSRGILYNAVNLEEIERTLSMRHEYKYRAEAFSDSMIVAYAGRLIEEKGILKLLKAVQSLYDSGIKIRLIVAGDGALFDVLKKMEVPYIQVLGRLDFADVIMLMNEADIFCLPTDYPEGFPTSVLEAAACKTFIITTEKGGSKELILDDSYGIILSENAVERIADAISFATCNHDYRKSAIEKTYDRLKQHFVWEQTTRKVLRLAEELGHT